MKIIKYIICFLSALAFFSCNQNNDYDRIAKDDNNAKKNRIVIRLSFDGGNKNRMQATEDNEDSGNGIHFKWDPNFYIGTQLTAKDRVNILVVQGGREFRKDNTMLSSVNGRTAELILEDIQNGFDATQPFDIYVSYGNCTIQKQGERYVAIVDEDKGVVWANSLNELADKKLPMVFAQKNVQQGLVYGNIQHLGSIIRLNVANLGILQRYRSDNNNSSEFIANIKSIELKKANVTVESSKGWTFKPNSGKFITELDNYTSLQRERRTLKVDFGETPLTVSAYKPDPQSGNWLPNDQTVYVWVYNPAGNSYNGEIISGTNGIYLDADIKLKGESTDYTISTSSNNLFDVISSENNSEFHNVLSKHYIKSFDGGKNYTIGIGLHNYYASNLGFYDPNNSPVLYASFTASGLARTRMKKSEIKLDSWLSNLKDDTPLYRVSIPGTHDTGTYSIKWNYLISKSRAQCQGKDIEYQLNHGIRALDLRPSEVATVDDKPDLWIYHGFVPTNVAIRRDVISASINFLKKHKDEFIIFLIKQENNDEGVDKRLSQIFNDQEFSEYIYKATVDHNTILKDIRGKIILLFRNREVPAKPGQTYVGGWPDNTPGTDGAAVWNSPGTDYGTPKSGLYIQDRYSTSVEDKVNLARNTVIRSEGYAMNGCWTFNYLSLSASGALLVHDLWHIAKFVNEKMYPFLENYPRKYSGLMFLDWMDYEWAYGPQVTRTIIENNYKPY